MSYLSVNNTINQSLDDDDDHDNNVNRCDLLKDSADIHMSCTLHGRFDELDEQNLFDLLIRLGRARTRTSTMMPSNVIRS